jgi:hypothetical protein
MKIEVERLFTEVPDELHDKGLERSLLFEVRVGYTDGRNIRIGEFCLEPMPGCCGIVVSTKSFLETNFRGSPHSESFHALKAAVAKYFGYTCMLMTTQLRNTPQVVSASKARWRFFHYFRNSRTSNDIGIAVKDI